MKYRKFLGAFVVLLIMEIAALAWFLNREEGVGVQDAVIVNEAVQSVQADWGRMESHQNRTELDYTVLDNSGTVLFQTKTGLSGSIHEAVIRRDTILDVEAGGEVVGKLIIENDGVRIALRQRQRTAAVFLFAALFQCALCVIYAVSVRRTVILPFRKLQRFAERVAGGNLDIPLTMDRQNLFGAFTESFDIMRSELKKARIAEAQANASKKELIAKISHDIRTPVSSIRAASEVGAATADNEKTRQNYLHIVYKADQINTLVTDLFSATLEELRQLEVEPADMKSSELYAMLSEADYFHYAGIPSIPDCLVCADKIRLQQVFDNLFSNSYKYADTEIQVEAALTDGYLCIRIEDHGGGVPDADVGRLKEKYWRGRNTKNVEGAGLGLHIADSFMGEMRGKLVLENGKYGLAATVFLALSGNDEKI